MVNPAETSQVTPKLLRRLRLQAEITVDAVAKLMGVSQVRVTLIEQQRTCSPDVAERYLNALAALKQTTREK